MCTVPPLDDADGLVARPRQGRDRSLLNGQHHQRDVMAPDVAQRLQQVLHGRILALCPVCEQMARRSRLLLQRALFERSDTRRRVACKQPQINMMIN